MANRVVIQSNIKHSGVKDMHWGIRRFQKKDGTRTALGKKRDSEDEGVRSEDHVKARENKNKGTASLSNDELKKLNERLRLESDYKTLTTEKIEKAESFVGKALKAAASAALTDFSKCIMLGVAKNLVKEISPSLAEAAGFGVKAAAAVVEKSQAPKSAPASQTPASQTPAVPQLTKNQRKAAAAAARNKP